MYRTTLRSIEIPIQWFIMKILKLKYLYKKNYYSTSENEIKNQVHQ